MANFMNLITNQLGATAVNHLAKKMGVNSTVARLAISAAVPLLVNSMARNTSKSGGASSLANALDRDHDGSILDDLVGFIDGSNRQNERASNGAGILSHLLGNRRSNVEQVLSRDTGLDQGATSNLLETLAPIVLGQLGREKRQNNLDQNGIAELLRQQRDEDERRMQPEQRNFISNLLDKDGDGKIDADFAQQGLGVLSKLFGK